MMPLTFVRSKLKHDPKTNNVLNFERTIKANNTIVVCVDSCGVCKHRTDIEKIQQTNQILNNLLLLCKTKS